MAWSTPATATAGSILTAAIWNASVRDNLLETAAAKATTAGSHFASTATNTLAERITTESEVATQETTTSTSYTDLATGGPTVTVTTGTKALVLIHGALKSSVSGTSVFMSVAVTGASAIAADDGHAVRMALTEFQEATAHNFFTTLTAGSNIFTAKYKIGAAGTLTAANRRVTVIPF